MKRRLLGVAAAALAALSGCYRRAKDVAPSRQASALAARMDGRIYRGTALAYPVLYRLYSPPPAASDARYPLLVYLHGAGGRGADNFAQLGPDVERFLSLDIQSMEPFFVLAPQCPAGDEWINRHADPPFRTYDQSQFPESDAAKATLAIIAELVRSKPIDPDRVYMTGPSMGGSGTWDFITRHPEIVAAAVPVTGVGNPSRAFAIARLPVWAFHGTRDDISPIENARAMRRALQAVGSSARFTELEGVGHDSWTFAYGQRETYAWLLAQRRVGK